MKKSIFCWLLWSISIMASGQDISINDLPGNNIHEKNDYFFARLSRARMQSNVLADKGLVFIIPLMFTKKAPYLRLP
jgi:hypothetical protein